MLNARAVLRATYEFVLSELDSQKSSNSDQIWLGYTHQPSQWVEEVAEDEFQGERTVISAFVDKEGSTDIGKDTVNDVHKRDDGEHIAENKAGNS